MDIFHEGVSAKEAVTLVSAACSALAGGTQPTANNTPMQANAQIAADMEQWAEHLDQHSNESTYCRIQLWRRQLLHG